MSDATSRERAAYGRGGRVAGGRYCPPRVCYCGKCAWWTPIPEPDYRYLIAAAEKASEKQRRSWANREESTWIDDL